jgi:hypothetical protein
MLEKIPFSWLESNGWLALSGSADRLSEIRAQALSRVNVDGFVAYISLADDAGDSLMDDMVDLGAPTGYFVDLENDDNNTIYERLSTANMIVVEPGDSIDLLKKMITQTVIQAIKEALNLGALILFEGLASNLAGEHIVTVDGQIKKGMRFVNNVYISSDVESILDVEDVQKIVTVAPETVFIGIQCGSALVLGPNGTIETWGEKRVTISLDTGLDDSDPSNNNV